MIVETLKEELMYNNKCNLCGSQCYIGLDVIECSNPTCSNFIATDFSKIDLSKLNNEFLSSNTKAISAPIQKEVICNNKTKIKIFKSKFELRYGEKDKEYPFVKEVLQEVFPQIKKTMIAENYDFIEFEIAGGFARDLFLGRIDAVNDIDIFTNYMIEYKYLLNKEDIVEKSKDFSSVKDNYSKEFKVFELTEKTTNKFSAKINNRKIQIIICPKNIDCHISSFDFGINMIKICGIGQNYTLGNDKIEYFDVYFEVWSEFLNDVINSNLSCFKERLSKTSPKNLEKRKTHMLSKFPNFKIKEL